LFIITYEKNQIFIEIVFSLKHGSGQLPFEPVTYPTFLSITSRPTYDGRGRPETLQQLTSTKQVLVSFLPTRSSS